MLPSQREADHDQGHAHRDTHRGEDVDQPIGPGCAIHVALRHGQKDREIPEYAKAKDASLERCPGVGEHDEATLDAMCNQHLSEEDRDDSDEENRDPGCRRRVRDPRGAACLPSMARESMGSNEGTLRRE